MAEEMLPGLKYVLRLCQEKDPCFRKHGLQKKSFTQLFSRQFYCLKRKKRQFVGTNLVVVNRLNGGLYGPNVCHYGFKSSQNWQPTGTS